MTINLPVGLTDTLLWSDELGIGFHGRQPIAYEGEYFQRYRQLDATPMGEALTAARVDMVRRHTSGLVVDIGIGGGLFVERMGCHGYDISAEAKAWLVNRGAYVDPYADRVYAITCWDSLEHIPDPAALIAQVDRWAFVSMPIYQDQADVLRSKHYKPGEHLHYFTVRGLVGWFAQQGFGCVEINEKESQLGREGIISFAFRRF